MPFDEAIEALRGDAPGACRQCATCCRKGGPALHLEDQGLIAQGTVTVADLVTLRAGEPVYDNVRQALIINDADIVKIKGSREGSWACRFLDGKLCGIYDHRPLECRLLSCTAPGALAAQYVLERLDRATLLARDPWLGDIFLDHQERCAYTGCFVIQEGRVRLVAEREEVSQRMSYDHHLRVVLQEKGAIPAAWLDFVLGRPMRRVINQVTNQVERQTAGSGLADCFHGA